MMANTSKPIELTEWIVQLAQGEGLFMTGTDTDVGKTWVGVKLLEAFHQAGVRTAPRKPVESGWPQPPESTATTDAQQLLNACHDNNQTLDQVCPNRFREPLSPPRAAQLEGVQLSIQTLAQQCRQQVPENTLLYVEGAGGFYSPLADDGLNADLATALKLPLILVSPDRVGCINHILLNVEAIQTRQLTLAGIILNPMPQLNTPATMDNLTDLRTILDIPVFRWQE
ncbi:MAG: Dethiobiotin synthetase (EC [uncultured Thiotrichaceae bacterium]|uniref:ATP-dependent dethiobiotin synthetase BioD n=1 Tax=uncultured Thiotrichaceae bacterium TaxID=298394 RepID=A0A6S6TFI5_9GAMM|nr:MAG: Dethiobiotin synthetase (EC [uncultured Thiotrichaceae bacterium]